MEEKFEQFEQEIKLLSRTLFTRINKIVNYVCENSDNPDEDCNRVLNIWLNTLQNEYQAMIDRIEGNES